MVRDATAADHAAARALNNSEVPHVNALDETEFAWIAANAGYFRVAEDAEGLIGVVMCVPSGLDYWSDNYKWFTARFDRFLYLDRVVVAARARRIGAGRALYDDLAAFAAGKWPRITLEVNERPPNPVSLAFHERMGYTRVGIREYEEGKKAVVMMERPLG